MHILQSTRTDTGILSYGFPDNVPTVMVSNYTANSQKLQDCVLRASSEFISEFFPTNPPSAPFYQNGEMWVEFKSTHKTYAHEPERSATKIAIPSGRKIFEIGESYGSNNANWTTLLFLSEFKLFQNVLEAAVTDEVNREELTDALQDLYEATDEAREEGFPVPSDAAKTNAERLIKEMYDILPGRFEVYPTPYGEIAIDAPSGKGKSVVVFCNSEGGALCMVNMNGEHRRARYSNTNKLPDSFVRDALTELEK